MWYQSTHKKISLYPILSVPDVGRDSLAAAGLAAALNSRGFEASDGAKMKSTSHTLRDGVLEPEFDLTSVWRESLRLSEDGNTRFRVFSGGNFFELAALPFECVFFLEYFGSFDEQFRRVDDFRQARRVSVLTPEEKTRWLEKYDSVVSYFRFLREDCRVNRIITVNALKDPSQLADDILSLIK